MEDMDKLRNLYDELEYNRWNDYLDEEAENHLIELSHFCEEILIKEDEEEMESEYYDE